MSKYTRAYVKDATYFFTVVTHQRRPVFDSRRNVARLREAFQFVRTKRPFRLDAIVVLPDHLHCIWTMGRDADFSLRWQLIKTYFSRFTEVETRQSGKDRVWQPRFWEHLIRDGRDLERHFHYIHFNPVKHGFVRRPAEWPHSTFHRYVRLGYYKPDWGASQPDLIDGMDPE